MSKKILIASLEHTRYYLNTNQNDKPHNSLMDSNKQHMAGAIIKTANQLTADGATGLFSFDTLVGS